MDAAVGRWNSKTWTHLELRWQAAGQEVERLVLSHLLLPLEGSEKVLPPKRENITPGDKKKRHQLHEPPPQVWSTSRWLIKIQKGLRQTRNPHSRVTQRAPRESIPHSLSLRPLNQVSGCHGSKSSTSPCEYNVYFYTLHPIQAILNTKHCGAGLPFGKCTATIKSYGVSQIVYFHTHTCNFERISMFTLTRNNMTFQRLTVLFCF